MSVTKVDLHREQIAHAKTLAALDAARSDAASAKRELDAEKKVHANTRRLLDERTAWHNAARRDLDHARRDLDKAIAAVASEGRLRGEALAEVDRLKAELDRERAKPAVVRVETVTKEMQMPRAADTVTIAAQAARISLLERELVAAGVEVPQ